MWNRLLICFGIWLCFCCLSSRGDRGRCNGAYEFLASVTNERPFFITATSDIKTARTGGHSGTLSAFSDAAVAVPSDPGAIRAIADYFSHGDEAVRANLEKRLIDSRGGSIALTQLLPSFVEQSVGKTCAGPNCFNAVINYARSLRGQPTKNEVSGERDVVEEIEGNYKTLNPSVQLKPGDVVLLWHRVWNRPEGNHWKQNLSLEVAKDWTQRDVILDHAAVYVGGGMFFHKGAKGSEYPWVFVDGKTLVADYGNALTTTHRPK